MGHHIVPVTQGSPRFRTAELEGLRITDAEFAPNDVLAPHVHDRTVIAVMLEGSFDLTIRSRTEMCRADTVFVEPGEERHANTMGHAGARVLVVEPSPLYERETLATCRDLLRAPRAFRHDVASAMARRLQRELYTRDGISAAALEARTLEFLGSAAAAAAPQAQRPAPGWLLRARELLHDHPLRPWRVLDVAAEVGVHPVYLTQVFRQRFGVSLATYQRRRRLEWAAERLSAGAESLAEIALRAGFADQPHFTRAFKRFSGRTPARFRKEARRQAAARAV